MSVYRTVEETRLNKKGDLEWDYVDHDSIETCNDYIRKLLIDGVHTSQIKVFRWDWKENDWVMIHRYTNKLASDLNEYYTGD